MRRIIAIIAVIVAAVLTVTISPVGIFQHEGYVCSRARVYDLTNAPPQAANPQEMRARNLLGSPGGLRVTIPIGQTFVYVKASTASMGTFDGKLYLYGDEMGFVGFEHKVASTQSCTGNLQSVMKDSASMFRDPITWFSWRPDFSWS